MGLTTVVWFARPVVRRTVVVVLITLAGVISYFSVELRPAGAAVAAWWPAAGIGVAALLASRGSRVVPALGVLGAAIAANALAGREWGLTIGYGIGNAVEVWIVAYALTRGGPVARLDGVRDIGRFLVACAAGALTMAGIGALTALIVVGQALEVTFFSLGASHFSALLVILPLFLLTPAWAQRARLLEALAQMAVLAGLIWFVFSPGNSLPYSYLPFLALLWAAFRLPTVIVAAEIAVLATAAIVLTVLGGGPFAPFLDGDERITVLLLQGFLIVYALAALLISGSRNDWSRALARVEAQEELLRDGIVNAESGIVIAERTDDARLVIRGINRAALAALGRSEAPAEWFETGIPLAPGQPVLGNRALDDLLRRGNPGEAEIAHGDRRFDALVSIRPLLRGTAIVTVVMTDVTRRQEREDAAVQSLVRLRDLNQQKDDFIASVSHELRTPVTAIMGFAEQLADEPLSDQAQQAADVIDRNARRLADVIEDVLELSRLTGSATIRRATSQFDLRQLIEQAAEDARGLYPAREVHIDAHLPPEPVLVTQVRQDVQRVVANLLSNAVKFSPVGGVVTVGLGPAGDGVEVTIVDDGPGIPPAQLPLVWERFYRIQDESHRDAPGTGLGLPIVKALVEDRLHGRVTLEPNPRGTGTLARLLLPSDAPASPTTAALVVPDETAREERS